MEHSRKRFKTHLDSNLVHLHKNIYLNRSDPLYYEKIIRFHDPRSPEAHYRLGRQHEELGRKDAALYHYKQAMKVFPSPYYYPASSAVRHLEQPSKPKISESGSASAAVRPSSIPLLLKALLLSLLFLNLLLLAFVYGPAAVSKAVTWVKPWGIGKDVTYESAESRFVLHFPYGAQQSEVETALHKKALELSNWYPNRSITVYGLASDVKQADSKAVPMNDEKLKTIAFVMAEYNPSVDTAVKIRFLSSDLKQLRTEAETGANLVRTALGAYMKEHGQPPTELSQLAAGYPNNYLSAIPLEPATGSASARTGFDGLGGWVYDQNAGSLAAMFYPNFVYEASSGMAAHAPEAVLPYEPYRITVDPSAHRMQLTAGNAVVAEAAVGIGEAGHPTPEGVYTVGTRVRSPQGKMPGVYGSAALGLGELAIHGTADASSIGENASLGCIRLGNADMDRIYLLSPRGTEVVIRNGSLTRDGGNPSDRGHASRLLPAPPSFSSPSREGETAGNAVFHWLG
ncbi:L,D-transpeptidase family protein [Paenibacillus filicis]|uniref:L,D-transpeptidase family protein n=1 Tax=Paenibacillus gyeongsangnamensis TaxID=3388067 RepID=A0ABT4QI27_9BACL|nr:L,D-transpeptidase family protein [Paenibacillus filicis]MCZ8516527.1 L,D-transpeptidase family protein [Paenibacillus filicis]